MNKKIAIVGDGLLGCSINKKTSWSTISRRRNGFDLTNEKTWGCLKSIKANTIVNCVGFTDTHSTDRQKHWDTNYKGVVKLADFCSENDVKLIHISTDFVYYNSDSNATENDVPVHTNNWYSYTKVLADGYVQLLDEYLLIRCSHKDEPFKFKEGYINYIGNFDYVERISDLIIKLIENDADGVYNVGTEIKTMYGLGVRTNKNIKCSLGRISNSKHVDVTMDVTKTQNFLRNKK